MVPYSFSKRKNSTLPETPFKGPKYTPSKYVTKQGRAPDTLSVIKHHINWPAKRQMGYTKVLSFVLILGP